MVQVSSMPESGMSGFSARHAMILPWSFVSGVK